MNTLELDFILKKARLPERSEAFWTEFPQQVAWQLNRGSDSIVARRFGGVGSLPQNWFSRLPWGFATVICVLSVFAIDRWYEWTDTKASTDVLADAKVIRETLAMFPNQVRAIVEDGHRLSLVLSKKDNVPISPPLYVRICEGKHCSSLVTFSGQEIQVAGQKITVLSDAHGGIILVGNDFAWSSSEPANAKTNLKIEAKQLAITM